MELESNRIRAKTGNGADVKKQASVQNGRLNSKTSDTPKAVQHEVPSIRLSPEQIEEIHSDEYSLTLFYATRMEPLSILEMKRQFPEPEAKKVQSVMDRFLKVGLVHVTPDGRYYSNYPENYINYSHYRYDSDLEARKDSKVFQIMKEQTGKTDFWKDKTYFSMDAFYSDEQSKELLEMFKAIKLKAKEYANENAKKKSIKGMRFRRMKFYDMTFALLLMFMMSLGVSPRAFAGGNDPVLRFHSNYGPGAMVIERSGGGNDPTGVAALDINSDRFAQSQVVPTCGGGGHDPSENECGPRTGGGGHDPSDGPSSGNYACTIRIEGKEIGVKNPRLCKLQSVIEVMSNCDAVGEDVCDAVLYQIEGMIFQLNGARNE